MVLHSNSSSWGFSWHMFKLTVGNQDLFLRGEDHSFAVLPSRNSREIRQDFLYTLSFSPTYKPMQPSEDSKLSQNEQDDVMVCDVGVGQDWPCISWQQCMVCLLNGRHVSLAQSPSRPNTVLEIIWWHTDSAKVSSVLQQKSPKIEYGSSWVHGTGDVEWRCWRF